MKGNTWLGPPTILLLILGLCVVLSGCGDEGNEVTGVETEEITELQLISEEEARDVVYVAGIDEEQIVYFDVVPYDLSGSSEFEVAWIAVINADEQFLGTFVNAFTGELLSVNTNVPERISARLDDLGLNEESKKLRGINHYESYPWGYDLPTPFGNHRLTCGYGCGYHTGSNHYAVDLTLSHGECVPAPGSGWCMFAGDRGDGYGRQVIILGGQANGSNRYVYRMAHFSSISVVPGWWIDKGRGVGAAGCTGNCTGTHVHFSIHRGYYSGGRIYGNSVPLDRWPGPNDRVDYFNRNSTWQFSFNYCH